ncbi:hypothetical protein D3C84_228700 [compost metagenome]
MQHAESVTGTVAQRQDHVTRGDLFAVFQDHTVQLTLIDQQVGDLLLETDFTAQCLNFVTHGLDHAGQAEGADVRLADVEDFLRGAGLDEFGQDLAAMVLRVLDLAVQLAVGESPGTAFTELHVRFGVEHVLAPQAPGVLGALANFGAALENDRLEAHLCQQQAGKNAARAETDHYRAFAQALGGVADRLVADVRGLVDVAVFAELAQQCSFVAHAEVDGVDELQVGGFLARIVAALEEGELQQFIVGDPQALHDGWPQGFVRMIQGQFQFSDS